MTLRFTLLSSVVGVVCATLGAAQQPGVSLPRELLDQMPPEMAARLARGAPDPAKDAAAAAKAEATAKRASEMLGLIEPGLRAATRSRLRKRLAVEPAAAAGETDPWLRCTELLRELPESDAADVFLQLLKGFQRERKQYPKGQEYSFSRFSEREGEGEKKATFEESLSPAEVTHLVRLFPFRWSDDHERTLASLVEQCVQPFRTADPVLTEQMQRSLADLARESDLLRMRACRMLVAAGLEGEALRCLPAVDALLAAKDLDTLAVFQEALARGNPAGEAVQRWHRVDLAILELLAGSTEGSDADREKRRSGQLAHSVRLMSLVPAATRRERFARFAELGLLGELVTAALDQTAYPVLSELIDWLGNSLTAADRERAKVLAEVVGRGWYQEAGELLGEWRTNAFHERDDAAIEASGGYRSDDLIERRHALLASMGRLLGSAPTVGTVEVDPTLTQRAALIRYEFLLETGRLEEARALLATLEGLAPSAHRGLIARYLEHWSKRHDPNGYLEDRREQRVVYTSSGRVTYMSGDEPEPMLVRPRDTQLSAIITLAELLRDFRRLPGGDGIDPEAVSAFIRIHSVAEAYRVEDVEAVFGPLQQVSTDVLAGLTKAMVAGLGKPWVSFGLQKRAKTGRNEADHAKEVARAVGLLDRIVEVCAERPPQDRSWRIPMAQAQAYLHWANYARGSGQEDEKHLERRSKSLELHRKTAAEYESWLSLHPEQHTIELHRSWFATVVTGKKEFHPGEVGELVGALDRLPQPEREWHREQLAMWFEAAFGEIKPEEKYYFAKGIAHLLADHPFAGFARRLAEKYERLLAGVRIHVEVDGPVEVGTNRAFGFKLGFRYTAEALRASDGFGRYLRDELEPGTDEDRRAVNYRSDIQKAIRHALAPNLEVVQATFHEPGTLPRALDGALVGWLETPVVYVIARAKDRAVEALPPIPVDLDFYRGREVVVLPSASNPVPIHAAVEAPPFRPLEKLKVQQTLDERTLKDDKLRIAVSISAVGILPPFDEILTCAPGPYRLDKTVPGELSVLGLDADSGRPLVEIAGDLLFDASNAGPEDTFAFPVPRASLAAAPELAYRRYSLSELETDIGIVEPTVALRGWERATYSWFWWVLALLPVVLAGSIWLWRRRLRPVGTMRQLDLDVPPILDGMRVSLLLRRIGTELDDSLSSDDRKALTEDLGHVERSAFGGETAATPPNLDAIARRWVERARRLVS